MVIGGWVAGCGVGSHGHERERHPRQHQECVRRVRRLVLDAHEVPVPEARGNPSEGIEGCGCISAVAGCECATVVRGSVMDAKEAVIS